MFNKSSGVVAPVTLYWINERGLTALFFSVPVVELRVEYVEGVGS